MTSPEPREPKRLRLSRAKGYQKPEGAIVVSRPSRWGNPIRITPERSERDGRRMYRVHGSPMDISGGPSYNDIETARYFAAKFFEWDLLNDRYGDAYPSIDEIRRQLEGKDLCCWCPLPGPRQVDWCHAAVLLRIVNGDLDA